MQPRVTTRAAIAVAIAAAAATGIAAAQPASVSGTMTIHGAPIKLRHAIAQSYTSPPGGAVTVYAVALTDRPLPEGALDGPEGAGVRRLAYEKKVRGLLLLIEPSDPTGATAVALDRMLKVTPTPKAIAALQAGFGPTARAQNEVVLKHFLDDPGFAEHTKKRAREMRSALDSASRVVERGRWATIVPADANAKPIELVAGDGGRWLLGQ